MTQTLLPESATLGWLVSFGPLVYMPFLACALMILIQVQQPAVGTYTYTCVRSSIHLL